MRRRCLLFLLVLLALAGLIIIVWRPSSPSQGPRANPPELAARHRLHAGRIIALQPAHPDVQQLARDAERWLGVVPTEPWQAINGTEALAHELPLYARQIVLGAGRHDHMQLGNAAMLGCLLSHTALWRWWAARPHPNDTLLVLEEDAYLDEDASPARLATLLDHDLAHERWDILLLEPGHLTVAGPMRPVGDLAMTWASPLHRQCSWMGTRGYLLRASGAAKLLRHAEPPSVQVDALLGLVASFEPEFRMFWTRASVAHQRMLTLSTVQDRCLKCYMPQTAASYLLGLAGVAAASSLATAAVISAYLRRARG